MSCRRSSIPSPRIVAVVSAAATTTDCAIMGFPDSTRILAIPSCWSDRERPLPSARTITPVHVTVDVQLPSPWDPWHSLELPAGATVRDQDGGGSDHFVLRKSNGSSRDRPSTTQQALDTSPA
ncbi:hypothetical protein K461DRAFT_30060 [Myriangium duriaei CBS 260.36]|uniref:Uncharacterized protein n=1 Tax=Myriangium duriaei CBS 260.36 TaxID=1168546 RepID=A0A9P4MMA3_9PEZI|nr:hypothetical protein K461DRAFT_30060 [Myriangium duriaei CBS 260.36]